MKRTLFVVALAAVLVFALAGSAFAIDRSGQDRSGASSMSLVGPDANNINVYTGEAADVDGVSTPGAGALTYEDWDKTLPGNVGNGNSPHGNYTTSTVKCVVCHAVHYAAPGNATVASGNQDADTLLRMKASDACIYCHATAGVAVNGRPVYNGLGGIITGAGATGGATNTGHAIGTNCDICHASVHGMGSDESVASLQGYLLKKLPVTDMQGTAVDTTNMIDAVEAIDFMAQNEGFAAGAALNGTVGAYASDNNPVLREQAVGVFCAECHSGAYATAAAGASTSVKGAKLSGHRIAASATNNWNADGSVSSGSAGNLAVAWAAANNCKDCHDAKDNYGNVAFPHAWGDYNNTDAATKAASGTKMWLTSAADSGATKDKLAIGAGDTQLSDGVCLKCHVASGGSAGVGITF